MSKTISYSNAREHFKDETFYLLSNKNNKKHLLHAIKNQGSGKKIVLKSIKDINNLFFSIVEATSKNN